MFVLRSLIEDYKSRQLEKNRSLEILNNYARIIELADIWLKDKTKEEKILLLDYLIAALTDNLCASGVAAPLIKEYSEPFIRALPLYCYDESGMEVCIRSEEEIDVDLTHIKVYVSPWKNDKMADNLLTLAKIPFKYYINNHLSDYYTEIEFCHVHNENHSIVADKSHKKGVIKSKLCRTELLYPHCTTDGKQWYNAHSGSVIGEVQDFRLAAVYTLSQKRYQCKNS